MVNGCGVDYRCSIWNKLAVAASPSVTQDPAHTYKEWGMSHVSDIHCRRPVLTHFSTTTLSHLMPQCLNAMYHPSGSYVSYKDNAGKVDAMRRMHCSWKQRLDKCFLTCRKRQPKFIRFKRRWGIGSLTYQFVQKTILALCKTLMIITSGRQWTKLLREVK